MSTSNQNTKSLPFGFTNNTALLILSLFLAQSIASFAYAQQPRVGRKAAESYFTKEAEPKTRGFGDSMLMLHFGKLVSSQAYKWKNSGRQENVARNSYGITYLFNDWGGMDVNFRGDFMEFDVDGTSASKMSFLGLLTFPRVETRFPLYFGLGAGPGVFFTQVEQESNLSIDYQLVAGARFMDLAETNAGFFFEFAMKNHLHILSDGQLNGNAVSGGAIFSF